MLSPLRMPFRHARVAVSFITRNLARYPSSPGVSTFFFGLGFVTLVAALPPVSSASVSDGTLVSEQLRRIVHEDGFALRCVRDPLGEKVEDAAIVDLVERRNFAERAAGNLLRMRPVASP
jgi:hypothetical protein